MRHRPNSRRWTVWWWPIGFDYDHDLPVPQSRTFSTRRAAVKWAELVYEQGADWAKVFRTDDSYDVAWHRSRNRTIAASPS